LHCQLTALNAPRRQGELDRPVTANLDMVMICASDLPPWRVFRFHPRHLPVEARAGFR